MPDTSAFEVKVEIWSHIESLSGWSVLEDIFREDGVNWIGGRQFAGTRWRTQIRSCKEVVILHGRIEKLRGCGCTSRRYHHTDRRVFNGPVVVRFSGWKGEHVSNDGRGRGRALEYGDH